MLMGRYTLPDSTTDACQSRERRLEPELRWTLGACCRKKSLRLSQLKPLWDELPVVWKGSRHTLSIFTGPTAICPPNQVCLCLTTVDYVLSVFGCGCKRRRGREMGAGSLVRERESQRRTEQDVACIRTFFSHCKWLEGEAQQSLTWWTTESRQSDTWTVNHTYRGRELGGGI